MNRIFRRSFASRNLLGLSERHGFISNFFPREQGHEIAAFLEKDKRVIYAGFDPTASSLHIGNLLVIMGLLHAQKAGHQSLALIGGATARIGDPSGKSEERPSLTKEALDENVKGIKKNLNFVFKHFESIHGIEAPKIVNNADWYENLNLIDFIAEYGKHYRMGSMLAKESVKRRLESVKSDPSGGMSLSEFTYQAFQAYDWLHLSQNYDCLVQLGGHDQMGNISAGHDLIKRVTGKESYGLLLPLLTNDAGQKLGKSDGNSVWLLNNLTGAFEFYQYFLRIPDSQVEQMLNYFTFMPSHHIKDVVKSGQRHPEKREAQQKLATEVTRLIHGEDGLQLALKTTQILYGNDPVEKVLLNLSKKEMKQIFKGAKIYQMIYKPGMTLLDFANQLKVFQNEKVAQNMIVKGGFYVNQSRRTNIDEMIIHGNHILSNDVTLVRIGKKNYIIVEWME